MTLTQAQINKLEGDYIRDHASATELAAEIVELLQRMPIAEDATPATGDTMAEIVSRLSLAKVALKRSCRPGR